MTTSDVELGIVALLKTLGLGAPVLGCGDTIPDHAQSVLVACRDCPHVAGPATAGGLYDAVVTLAVWTPSQLEALTYAQHGALLSQLQESWDAVDSAAVSAALVEAAGCKLNGWYFSGPADSHESGRWVTELQYRLGLEVV